MNSNLKPIREYPHALQHGFSLIELMVVISIISVLATTVAHKYKEFVVKAKRTESRMNMNALETMVVSYKAEYDGPPPLSEFDMSAGVGWSSGSEVHLMMSTGDFSTETSCHVANPFGFRITNCKDARYSYKYKVLPSNLGHFVIHSYGNGICPSNITAEFLALSLNEGICLVRDSLKNKCTGVPYAECFNRNGYSL